MQHNVREYQDNKPVTENRTMLTQQTLRYPKIGKPAEKTVLSDDLILEQWIIPKDTVIKTVQTSNFGYVILQADQKDKRGFIVPKRLFRN